jgi:hypothetical protein
MRRVRKIDFVQKRLVIWLYVRKQNDLLATVLSVRKFHYTFFLLFYNNNISLEGGSESDEAHRPKKLKVCSSCSFSQWNMRM